MSQAHRSATAKPSKPADRGAPALTASALTLLGHVAKWFAVLAGVLLVGITVLTLISIIGRDFFGRAITGDFELTAAACGAAVSLFLPWCQYQRGHIVVDFFTAWAGNRAQNGLDRIGAALMTLSLAVLAWRSAIGGLSAYQAQSASMMLGFPDWVVYSVIVPGLGLAAAIALLQVFVDRQHHLLNPLIEAPRV